MNAQSYRIVVTAINGAGAGTDSLASSAVVPVGAPGRVTDAPTVTPGIASASVAFAAPSDNGAAISSYVVEVTNTTAPGTFSVTGSSSPIVVPGLATGQNYRVRVHAVNIVGAGPNSPQSGEFMAIGVPSQPSQVTATAGLRSASVAFTAPSDGGASISSYAVEVFDGSGGAESRLVAGTSSPIAVSDLVPGHSYSFRVNAANIAGTSRWSQSSSFVTPFDVPSQVTSVVVTTVGSTGVQVSCADAAANGSSILGYVVEATDVTDPTRGGQRSEGERCPVTLDGLTQGDDYSFTVTARNALGSGLPSLASTPLSTASAPGMPTSVAATASSDSAMVSFVAPAANGSPITGYTVVATDLSHVGNGGQVATGSSSPVLISGLTPGDYYVFRVTASNNLGSGQRSDSSNGVTPAAVPDMPVNVSAARQDSGALLSWTTPSSNGSAILRYDVTVRDETTDQTFSVSKGLSDGRAISGLVNGDRYSFTVAAVNAVGTGDAASSNSVIPAGAPGKAINVTADSGDRSATIAWSAAAGNGSEVTGYLVTDDDGHSCSTDNGSAGSCTIAGLTNGISYQFRVIASNGAGSSDGLAPSVTPLTIPGVPVGVAAEVRDNPVPTEAGLSHVLSARVSWSAPGTNGGSRITAYLVTASDQVTGARSETYLLAQGLTDPPTYADLADLVVGDEYTFTVTAMNAAGSGSAVVSSHLTIASAPDPAVAPTVVAGRGSVSVSWSAPNDNGSPITGYAVTDGSGHSCIPGIDETTCTISGLTNGTTYSGFRVETTNGLGTSTSYESTRSAIPTDVPNAPAEVIATRGDASADVTWSAPSDNGEGILGYTIVAIDLDNAIRGGQFVESTFGTSAHIDGLTNGDRYSFVVSARNALGSGAISDASNAVTPAGVPGDPANVAVASGDRSVTVSFDGPDANGAAITSYVVKARTPGGDTTSISGSSSPITLSGLTNGSPYFVTVAAVNDVGQGNDVPAPSEAQSRSDTWVVPATAPDAPTGLVVVAGDASANVAWSTPSNGGSAITYVTIVATDVEDGSTIASNAATVVGLINGHSYTFTVTVHNAVGSATSAPSATVTPSSRPGAPGLGDATAGDRSATVTFEAANANGISITSYLVQAIDLTDPTRGGQTATDAVSPIVVSGLHNGDRYIFAVSATNANGTGVPVTTSDPVVPFGVPGKPTIQQTTAGDSSILVSFGASPSNGSPVTGYSVVAHDLDATNADVTATGLGSPILVSGLTNGDRYEVSITATNAAGASDIAQSYLGNPVPAGLPGAPTAVVVTPADQSLQVRWTQPSTNGSRFTNFTVTTFDLDDPTLTKSCSNVSCGVILSSAGIGNLINGHRYVVKVSATNGVGTGPESAGSTPVTPAWRPYPPTSVVATPGNGSASVAFGRANGNGGDILGYTVTATDRSNPANAQHVVSGSASPIVVDGLTNGDEYVFAVTVTTDVGTSDSWYASATPRTIPGAPAGVTASSGNGTATVAFSAPVDNGGAAVTSYTVTATDETSETVLASRVTGPQSPLQVSGLTNGHSYSFTVAAENVVGGGPDSTSSNPVTPAQAPGPVRSLSVERGDGSATLTFRAPANDGGSAVTGYTVSVVDEYGNVPVAAKSGSSSPIVVPGLRNGYHYNFSVRPTNAVGEGASVSTPPILIATVPDIPYSVTATPGDGLASVKVSLPTNSLQGNVHATRVTITAIDTTYGDESTNPRRSRELSWPASTFDFGGPEVFPGLINGHSYVFTATVSNSEGTGPSSDPTTAVVPAGAPDAPTDVVASSGAASASVNFTAPSGNGAPITGYSAVAIDLTDPERGGQVATGAAAPLTLTGLTNGDNYVVAVTATNSAGDSSSAQSGSVVPRDVPSVPSSVTAEPGDGSALVSFAPPSSNGSSITGYTVVVHDLDESVADVTSKGLRIPILVTGLTNGHHYSFSVSATNAVGSGAASASSDPVTTPVGPPGAPSSVTATAGVGAVTVTFGASADDGGLPIDYLVNVVPLARGYGGGTTSATTSPLTIDGLSNGVPYLVSIVAHNQVGYSSAVTSTIVTPRDVPTTPSLVTASRAGTTATVSFGASIDNGSPISKYTVTARDFTNPARGGQTCQTDDGATTSCDISSLTYGDYYLFDVVATNQLGDSAVATSTFGNGVLIADVPSAPTAVSATHMAGYDGGAWVSFATPAANGSALGLYHVTAWDQTNTLNGKREVSAYSSPQRIEGLTVGHTYVFTVSASNAIGSSTDSAASDSFVAAGLPGTPGELNSVPGDGWLDLSWVAPSSDGGSPITGYTVTLTGPDGDQTCSTSLTSCRFDGLINGQDYSFSVSATNVVGTGQLSDLRNAGHPVAGQNTPGAPRNVVVDAGAAQASVRFSAPTSDGNDQIRHFSVITRDAQGAVVKTTLGESSPIVVGGLTPGATYTFAVSATNSMGTGDESPASDPIALPVRPGAPRSVVATASPGSASVAFVAPADNGGLPISGYTVTATDTTSPADGGQTASGQSSPIVITGLANGDSYTFTVSATNAVGVGTSSDASTAVTPRTTPNAPGGTRLSTVPVVVAPSVSNSQSVTTDQSGNVYISNNRLWKATPSGSVSEVGGSWNGRVVGSVVDKQGNVFVLTSTYWTGNVVKIAPDGTRTTFTTTGSNPLSIGVDDAGNIYVASQPAFSSGGSVIRTSPDGVTTEIGSDWANGPSSIAVDGSGNVYVVDTDLEGIQKISTDGTQSTIGTGTGLYPTKVALDAAGNLFVSTSYSAPLTKIAPNGQTTSVGPNHLDTKGMAVDASGNLYVATDDGVVELPSAPMAVAGDGEAAVSFTPPNFNGGAPVTGYTVTATDLTDPERADVVVTGTTSPITVTGLVNGDSYSFVVTADNALGTGAPSAATNSVVPSGASTSTPGAPASVRATRGDGSASVAFTAPASHGSPITQYTVTVADQTSPGSGGQKVTGTASPILVSGLTNGHSYRFTVTATNGLGDGSPSAASQVVPAGLPLAPTLVVAEAKDGSAIVQFSPRSGNGSAITGYTVSVTDETDGTPVASQSGSSSPITVTGLTNGHSYSFTVMATTDVGSSDDSWPSDPVTPFKPATAPAKPTDVVATPGEGSASVSFSAPADNGGSAITSYTVRATNTDRSVMDPITPVSGSSSPITVTGLTNGSNYRFTVEATNGIGTGASSLQSDAVTPATAPGKPANVVASPGDGSVSVAFDAPSDGGSPITGYTVYVDNYSSMDWIAPVSGSSSPIVVSGLTNGYHYRFTVQATNAVRSGRTSDPSTLVTPAQPIAPAKPTNVVATPGNTSASVAFDAPTDNGGSTITGYTVSVTDETDGTPVASQSGSSSPIMVTGLTNGHSYSFTVAATNAAGTGAASDSSSPVTPTGTLTRPAKPTNVVATPGNTSASVAFSDPTDNGGSTITGYTVSVTDETDGTPVASQSGSSSPIGVTGLTNGHSYSFTVAATNAAGTGDASNASSPVTPVRTLTRPAKPTNVVATPQDAWASVAFSAPTDDGGSVITGYTVSVTDETDGTPVASQSGSSSPIGVTGLTNGHSYSFTVAATNTIGTGDASDPSSPVTPVRTLSAPAKPTNVVATPGNTSASVAFSTPVDDGGSVITGYTVSIVNRSRAGSITPVSGPSSPIVVTGLTNGDSYLFTVVATNVVGTSDDSRPSDVVTPFKAVTAPTKPTTVVATPGDTSASVAFSAPTDDGGSTITGYTVSVTDETDGTPVASQSGSASPIVVTGLTNGHSHSFTVAATNAIGTGDASDSSSPLTPVKAATAPAKPTNVVATPGNTSASVAFDAPTDDGGSAITGYTVSVTDETDGTPVAPQSGSSSPIVVTGLTNGHSYSFSVAASNVVGSGDASNASSPVTPVRTLTAPNKPTNVVATPGNTSASVAFSDPTDNGGSAITGFKVRVLGRRGGVITTTTGSSSPITVTGLMNGRSYGFTVAATNEQGTGAASTESVAITPSGRPGAPVGFGHSGAQTVVASGLADPSGVALDRDGNRYVALAGGVDKISADNTRTLLGAASTWAGTLPRGVATDAAGNVYVTLMSLSDGSGRVVVVAPDGSSRTTASGLCDVQGVAVDEEGSLYVTCPGGHAVLEISKDGVTSPIGSNWGAPSGIAVDANGNVFVADRSRAEVVKIAPNGFVTAIGQASLMSPQGIAVDDAGHVYVAQATEHAITKIDPDGALSTLGAGLRNPRSIALGEDGTLTVVDADTGRLVRIENPPLVEVGDGQATISFASPGSDGGAVITGYVVTVFDSSGGVLTSKHGASSPITVTGLTNGQNYSFAVQATNRHGDGALSTRTALVELKIPEPAPTAPEAPTLVSVDPGNGSGLVVFTAPRDNGSPISKYTVTATDVSNAINGGQKCSTPDGATLECLVTGLVNGDDYAFSVVATNAEGDSPPSTLSSTITPATNPGAPTITSATRGNASATIAWTDGAANGSAIQSPSIYAFSGSTLVASKTNCSGSPCTISGLTNGTTYTFKVSNTNGVGEGDLSVASGGVTPATNPGAPTITSATRGNASATIAWTDGAANGSGIQSSSIYAYVGASAVATQTGCVASPCTMTGLTVGTTYTFKVSHANGVGEGAQSVASGEVTPATTPGAPVDAHATPGNAQVTLDWSVPLTNGGSRITGYTARIGSRTCSTGAAGRQCTITGLVNGVAGSAVVTATNALGAGAEASLSVTALASAPSFTSANSGSGVPGKTIKFAVTTATLVAPTSKTGTWLSAEDLPAGVTFTAGKGTKANTGTISGLAPNSATSSFTLVASNAAGVGTRQVFTLRSVAFSSNSPATVTMQAGLAGSVLIESTDASAVITTSSVLPDGLQFSAEKGIATISGTPTTGKAKAVSVKLTATDGSATATWVISILVNSAPGIVVTGTTTQVHKTGSFSLKIAGTGFPAPSISVTHLPRGLSFSGGRVTGKIATAGTYSFDVEASNAVGSTALTVFVTAS